MNQALPFGIVLLGAIPGLLLLFCILWRLPYFLILLGGAICATMPETRVFAAGFFLFALVRWIWFRTHPTSEGKAREAYLREEAEQKSRLYESAEDGIAESRLLDEKKEEEWVAKSRRAPEPDPIAESAMALRKKVGGLFGKKR